MNPENSSEGLVPQEDYENLGDAELVELYMQNVELNPKYRALTREQIISGIKDPEAERARLREIDTASDRDERNPRG
jgi:hypothetical protein